MEKMMQSLSDLRTRACGKQDVCIDPGRDDQVMKPDSEFSEIFKSAADEVYRLKSIK
jgi:hypothetical protein